MLARCFALLLLSLPLLSQPTFYRDVLPILQQHCQECHRAGEIGPMPLVTFREVRPWAKAIRATVLARKMPPWFADPHFGKFSNNRTLSEAEIDTISRWAVSGAPQGETTQASAARTWPADWNIGKPDAVFKMPQPLRVPAAGELDYQYIIVPTGFTADRWVQKAEIRPGNRAVVHHAVVYVRQPGSTWMNGMPVGTPFTFSDVTKSDILFTYTPGNAHDEWPDGMGKLIPAGSDLVFQMHYTPANTATFDQTRIGLVFAKQRPVKRVLTLQLTNDRLFIPPGRADYRVSVSGTIPNTATLLSLYPHMHLRGKEFEYAIYTPVGRQVLLKVDNYDFYWQLTYRLAEPLQLLAGTKLECIAVFDNSRNNPRNPDPDVLVRYGQQSSDEMMIGFFDVAVDAALDKAHFFERPVR